MTGRSVFQFLIFSFLYYQVGQMNGQETFPVNGPADPTHNYYVFHHANIVSFPGNVLMDATLIIKDERIVSVGKGLKIPSKSVVYDLKGSWIYPSFIDLDSEYGFGKKKEGKKNDRLRRLRPPQLNSKKNGAFSWNEAIHPETDASELFHHNEKEALELRKMGYGAVLAHHHDGIMRGTSVFVHTGDDSDNMQIIRKEAANQLSFIKGSSKQTYPSSLMGTIALIRQTLYDAQWYGSRAEKEEMNLSLEAILKNSELPSILEVRDHLSVLRAHKISTEFELPLIVRGTGDEYRRIEEIKKTELPLIIPIELPLPYDVSNSYNASDVSIRDMKHWELAPFNARILHENQIEFALTSRNLKSADHWKYLRKIKSTGVPEEVILAGLTTVPAELLQVNDEIGKLLPGYFANFLICSRPIFEDEVTLLENWSNGKRYIVNPRIVDVRGEYNLNVNKNGGMRLVIEGKPEKLKGKIFKDKKEFKAGVSVSGNEITIRYNEGNKDLPSHTVLTGNLSDDESRILVGKGLLPNGNWVDWAGIRQKEFKAISIDSTKSDTVPVPAINHPLGPFGMEGMPPMENVLYKRATIWTNEDTGILKVADIAVSMGKILAVGQGLSKTELFGEEPVNVIYAEDLHITSGIIDEHSHIAISRGVNESGQEISAEVRIGDVINSDDINIYRQLSGGVTASQLLHGSANPIGGQSALIKLRWGLSPEEMKIRDADGFIKFALGENVKQSNWGDLVRIRYPQTRMGVEQVFYDGFLRAREYRDTWKIYQTGMQHKKRRQEGPIQPRVDLELESISEILNQERFITCHSYVASEITMLMRVADSMGISVNTFTHILEGYKVADKMQKHGAGGSTFSDWWAYKYEVNDAIPYNAAIMHKQGIVTAINSDDAEMGRRLNQEAAKTVKYGGVSEEEAWKMVSLNPAKLLHLDHRMGSLKAGKDADFVIWSDNPLSINARVEKTYIDGRCYFDRNRDEEYRKAIQQERARLIQLMLEDIERNKKKRPPAAKPEPEYHCDTESTDEEW